MMRNLKMVFCPFCDGQGLIDRATIQGTNIDIYICNECDTMWKTAKISENNCENFKEFMNSLGFRGLWEELTNVQRL